MTANPVWLTLVRGSALGWVPVATNDQGTAGQSDTDSSRLLTINVSGVRFNVHPWQLRRHPHTLLGSNELEFFWVAHKGEYYFDRDPAVFRYILNYYVTGKLHYPRHECVSSFESELQFFGISCECVDECCYEDFKEKQRDNKDRTQSDAPHQQNVAVAAAAAASFHAKVYNIFQNPQSGLIACTIYYVTGFFIAVSVTANIVDSVPYGHDYQTDKIVTLGEQYQNMFFVVDSACVALFTVEYIMRLYAAPNRLKFLRSIMSVIDLAAIVPYYVSLSFTDSNTFAAFVTLRVFRVFRIFKFSRHSAGLRILGATLKTCAGELGFLLFSLAMAIIIFATMVYYCEKDVPGTGFTSIPATFWYTIVTITTLGYGDITPSTVLGKIIGGICSLSGVLVIALPVPVIVSNFSRIYIQNLRISKHKMMVRSRMLQSLALRKAATAEYISRSHARNLTTDDHDQFLKNLAVAQKDNAFYSGPSASPIWNEDQYYHLLFSLEATTSRQVVALENTFDTMYSSEKSNQQELVNNRCLKFLSRCEYGRRGIVLLRRCHCLCELQSNARKNSRTLLEKNETTVAENGRNCQFAHFKQLSETSFDDSLLLKIEENTNDSKHLDSNQRIAHIHSHSDSNTADLELAVINSSDETVCRHSK